MRAASAVRASTASTGTSSTVVVVVVVVVAEVAAAAAGSRCPAVHYSRCCRCRDCRCPWSKDFRAAPCRCPCRCPYRSRCRCWLPERWCLLRRGRHPLQGRECQPQPTRRPDWMEWMRTLAQPAWQVRQCRTYPGRRQFAAPAPETVGSDLGLQAHFLRMTRLLHCRSRSRCWGYCQPRWGHLECHCRLCPQTPRVNCCQGRGRLRHLSWAAAPHLLAALRWEEIQHPTADPHWGAGRRSAVARHPAVDRHPAVGRHSAEDRHSAVGRRWAVGQHLAADLHAAADRHSEGVPHSAVGRHPAAVRHPAADPNRRDSPRARSTRMRTAAQFCARRSANDDSASSCSTPSPFCPGTGNTSVVEARANQDPDLPQCATSFFNYLKVKGKITRISSYLAWRNGCDSRRRRAIEPEFANEFSTLDDRRSAARSDVTPPLQPSNCP